MEYNSQMKIKLFFLILFCLWSAISSFANPINSFKNWNIKDGFALTYCTHVKQYRNQYLYIQHDDLKKMTVFDGYTANVIDLPTSDMSIRQVRDGLFWGSGKNKLFQYEFTNEITNGSWEESSIFNQEPQYKNFISFVPNPYDDLFFLYDTNAVFYDHIEKSFRVILDETTELGNIRAIIPYKNQVLLNCRNGIAIVDDEINIHSYPFPPELSLKKPMRITTSNDQAIYAVAIMDTTSETDENTSQRVQIVFQDSQWKVLYKDHDFETFFYNADGYYWGFDLANEGFIRRNDFKRERIMNRELSFSQFEDYCTLDPYSFSIATPEGLVRYNPPLWTEYSFQDQLQTHNITEPASDVIFTLCKFNAVSTVRNKSEQFTLSKSGMFNPMETENTARINDTLYVVVEQIINDKFVEVLMEYHVEQKSFQEVEIPFEYVDLFVTQLEPNTVTLVSKDTNSRTCYQYDGAQFTPLFEIPNDYEIGYIRYLDSWNGGLWICGTKGLLFYQDGNFTDYSAQIHPYTDGIHCAISLSDNEVWFGGSNGIVSFDGNRWIEIIRETQDVRSLLQSNDGSIWAACTDGIRRYFHQTWIHYSSIDGLPKGAVYDIFETGNGELIIGTNFGLWKFNPTYDMDKPVVEIDQERSYRNGNVGGDYQLNVLGKDRWKYTAADRLFFSYSFDNETWNSFEQNSRFTFQDLPAKDYTLYIKAMDLNGNISDPVDWSFTIPKPWYQQMGFYISLIISSVIILTLIIIAVIGHIKLRNSYIRLQQTKDHLIQSEKMASLGQLIAGVAHEINNPINYIKSNIEPLKEYFDGYKEAILTMNCLKEDLPENVRNTYEEIVNKHDLEFANEDSIKIFESYTEGTDRISKIVADLRQYSRSDKEYKTKININDSINSTLNLLQTKLKNGITLVRDYGELPNINCSPGQLGQVFMNLLSNAVDAVGDTGTITIRTGQEQDHIVISIKDDGPGIPNEIFNKIFDPFFTTKPVGSGTGLGLSITHKIIEQHDGSITVNSEEGKGTEFLVRLPINMQ